MSLNASSLPGLLRDGEILIIVPPFAALDRPSLAAHVLQACAGAAGFRVSVLYANLSFAAQIGVAAYNAVVDAPPHMMLGERLFSRSAHGLAPFGEPSLGGLPCRGPLGQDADLDALLAPGRIKDSSPALSGLHLDDTGFGATPAPPLGVGKDELAGLEERAVSFSDATAAEIARLPFEVVGATTTFEQTNPSLALLNRVKRARPEVVTLLGGANCEGEMAKGLASLDAGVDHIFSGEAEVSFPDFLRRRARGAPLTSRVIEGAPCMDLDAVPTPDFTEYFAQRARLFPGGAELGPATLPYESSRGCWWGQKHHCTFCGLNGQGMTFREKSADRVIEELWALSRAYPARGFSMTDNIMPHAYFKTLLPRLAERPLPLPLFYEQKSNLSLDNVRALKKAGVTSIQPGIEALSSALLRRMDKGVLARQNLMLLRYARAAGLDVQWNLLWAFPGDEPEAYEETLALLPLLRHLQPPNDLIHLSIDRFSPYYQRPAAYGIENLRPHPAYRAVFPPGADLDKIAYRFLGEYSSGAYRCLGVIRRIQEEVFAWRARWSPSAGPPPVLRVNPLGDDYLVRDTRGLPGAEEAVVLDRAEAVIALRAAPYAPDAPDPQMDRAIARRLGVVVDGHYVPLVTAAPELLLSLDDAQLSKSKEPRISHGFRTQQAHLRKARGPGLDG